MIELIVGLAVNYVDIIFKKNTTQYYFLPILDVVYSSTTPAFPGFQLSNISPNHLAYIF